MTPGPRTVRGERVTSAPDRMALAVAAFGSALAVVVAVQAPALVPALGVGLAVWRRCTSSCDCAP